MRTHVLLSRGIINEPFIFEYLKEKIKSTDKVVVIAYSFFPKYTPTEKAYQDYYGKNGEYYLKIINIFEPYGIKEEQISWVNYYQDSTVDATLKIKEADIIYFPGGAPELMMERIKEKGLQEVIENHQKMFIGSSAGAMIQMKEYHMSPDFDYPYFSYEEGLDLLKGFSIEVHYRRRKKQKAALRKVNRAFRHPIYAIPDDGAMIVEGNKKTLLGTAFQMYQDKGIMRSGK